MHKTQTTQITNNNFSDFKIRNFIVLFFCLFGIWSLVFGIFNADTSSAQGSMSITVTPPLFQVAAGPGETWASSLKLVNTNAYNLTLYASVSGFEAEGEGGHGKFIPIPESTEGANNTLSQWIELSGDPVVIPPQQSREIPFRIRIPENAPPGGHYAAILVGTQPPSSGEGNRIKISSYVTSLLFLRITGDIREEGSIREFSTNRSWYQDPQAVFTMRFENVGNVHLQPQGDIVIYNMWGKERGKIFINERTDFGNVLPSSIRKFVFEWQGEKNFFEAGKYKAVVTLGYGKEARQNISAIAYFWVVPVRSIATILGVLAAFIVLISWAIRRYVKKVLELEAMRLGSPHAVASGFERIKLTNLTLLNRQGSDRIGEQRQMPDAPQPVRYDQQMSEIKNHATLTVGRNWSAPIAEGIRDLRRVRILKPMDNSVIRDRSDVKIAQTTQMEKNERAQKVFTKKSMSDNVRRPSSVQISIGQYFRKYGIALLTLVLLLSGVAAAFIYFKQTLIPSRSYQFYIHHEDGRRIQIPAGQNGE